MDKTFNPKNFGKRLLYSLGCSIVAFVFFRVFGHGSFIDDVWPIYLFSGVTGVLAFFLYGRID